MSLTKEQVCVFIENEAHLQQAREVLEIHDHKILEKGFFLSSSNHNYLFYMDGGWSLSYFDKQYDTLITLSELEKILKSEQ